MTTPETEAALTECSICSRPLRDQVSRVLMIGPTCAERMGAPHNEAVARRVLDLREKRRADLDRLLARVSA